MAHLRRAGPRTIEITPDRLQRVAFLVDLLMRKAGLRSRAEINREINVLKILRGDFDDTIRRWTSPRR